LYDIIMDAALLSSPENLSQRERRVRRRCRK
jgi:hypothetical protein